MIKYIYRCETWNCPIFNIEIYSKTLDENIKIICPLCKKEMVKYD